jgi:hypothetical protein
MFQTGIYAKGHDHGAANMSASQKNIRTTIGRRKRADLLKQLSSSQVLKQIHGQEIEIWDCPQQRLQRR